MRTLIWAILTPVLMLGALEGVEIGIVIPTPAVVGVQSVSTVTTGPTTPPTTNDSLFANVVDATATPSTTETTVTEDDQGDLIVYHADEPFTYTATPTLITVTPAVHTSVFISAHKWPVPTFTAETGYGPDWWEATFDRPTTYAELELPGGCSKVSIVVIVNGHSQVSNLTLEVGCG